MAHPRPQCGGSNNKLSCPQSHKFHPNICKYVRLEFHNNDKHHETTRDFVVVDDNDDDISSDKSKK